MKEKRQDQRYQCADLVEVIVQSENDTGNRVVAMLEDICTSGACVQLERPIAEGTPLTLVCPTVEYRGTVRYCRLDEQAGYFVGIEFAPGERWSPDTYQPKHLLDPRKLATVPAAECRNQAGCTHGLACPRELVTRVVEPGVSLGDTVREVARTVAMVCGEQDESELQKCFARLFNSAPECHLFREFRASYRESRAGWDKIGSREENPVALARDISELLSQLPPEVLGSQTEEQPRCNLAGESCSQRAMQPISLRPARGD